MGMCILLYSDTHFKAVELDTKETINQTSKQLQQIGKSKEKAEQEK